MNDLTNLYVTENTEFRVFQAINTGLKPISKFNCNSLEIAQALARSHGITNAIPLQLYVIIPVNAMTVLAATHANKFEYTYDVHAYPNLSVGPDKHKAKANVTSNEIDNSHPLISKKSKHGIKNLIKQYTEFDLDFSALEPITTIATTSTGAQIPLPPIKEIVKEQIVIQKQAEKPTQEIYKILLQFVVNPDPGKRMKFATTISNPDLATANRDADLVIFNKIKSLLNEQDTESPLSLTIAQVSGAIALFYGSTIDITKFQSFFPHLTHTLAK